MVKPEALCFKRNLPDRSSSISIVDSNGPFSENSDTTVSKPKLEESNYQQSAVGYSVNNHLCFSMHSKLALQKFQEPNGYVKLQDFLLITVLGKGSFGKVYQVWRRPTTLEIYAMKVMRKDIVIERNIVDLVISERNILLKLDHPFIVKLRYSYQTKYRLYLVFDFFSGGNLEFHLSRQGLFREELARVYAAEIVSAMSYIHSNGIMHRDLKPANVLLDADGHIVLTDFGLATQFDWSRKTFGRCGTLKYMAPEVVLNKDYDTAADWWSFGILLFEMLTGEVPFKAKSRGRTEQKILKDKLKMPGYLTSEAHSLLKGLLQKEPGKRLGSGKHGFQGIKMHEWFKPINWKKLEAREIKPSFIPVKKWPLGTENFDNKWKDMSLWGSIAFDPTCPDSVFKGFPSATSAPKSTVQIRLCANRERAPN